MTNKSSNNTYIRIAYICMYEKNYNNNNNNNKWCKKLCTKRTTFVHNKINLKWDNERNKNHKNNNNNNIQKK